MTRPMIEVDALSKRYRLGQFGARTLGDEVKRLVRRFRGGTVPASPDASDLWALRDVSFRVNTGEVVGIIGRNGAGKSTLLKILSRVTEPTSGHARIRGRVASLLEVGTGFHPELTGRENIFLNGTMLGMTRSEIVRKFDEIVAFSETGRFIDTPVKRYSSGMYVRLAFSVAAHLEPEVLIVDEVLAVGDAAFQARCLGRMRDVAGQGRTVLFVSHNMAAVQTLCSSGLLFDGGRIAVAAAAPEVVDEYLRRNIARSEQSRRDPKSHIRSLVIQDNRTEGSHGFRIGDTLSFELELFHLTFLEYPRVSIGIHDPLGMRVATLHTDIQQNRRWGFKGRKRITAVWSDVRLAPGTYRVDVAFWGHRAEIETQVGIAELKILPTDVYGTGALPDVSFQGAVVADATWSVV